MPNKVQEGAAPIWILSSRVQVEDPQLRYVTALSINPELTGDGSALGAPKLARFVSLCQTACADYAKSERCGAV
jgi:hypothetical protein